MSSRLRAITPSVCFRVAFAALDFGCWLVVFLVVVFMASRLITPVRLESKGIIEPGSKKSPPRPEPGGPGEEAAMLRVDAIGPFSALGLEGLDRVASLLHRAGHEPANRVLLPAHRLHNLGQGSAVLALEHGDHLGGLAAFARPGA